MLAKDTWLLSLISRFGVEPVPLAQSVDFKFGMRLNNQLSRKLQMNDLNGNMYHKIATVDGSRMYYIIRRIIYFTSS